VRQVAAAATVAPAAAQVQPSWVLLLGPPLYLQHFVQPAAAVPALAVVLVVLTLQVPAVRYERMGQPPLVSPADLLLGHTQVVSYPRGPAVVLAVLGTAVLDCTAPVAVLL
jgi:hypothetical protein